MSGSSYSSETFGDGKFQFQDLADLLGFGTEGFSFIDIASDTSPYKLTSFLESFINDESYTPALDGSGNKEIDVTDPQSTFDTANDIANSNNTSAAEAADKANMQTQEWLNQIMAYNAEQAELAFNRSQNSADLAYQRELELMERAQAYQNEREDGYVSRMMKQFEDNGLNPKLAYKLLSGGYTASSPMGSATAVSSPSASANSASALKGDIDMSTASSILGSLISSSTSMSTSSLSALAGLIGTVISAVIKFKTGA